MSKSITNGGVRQRAPLTEDEWLLLYRATMTRALYLDALEQSSMRPSDKLMLRSRAMHLEEIRIEMQGGFLGSVEATNLLEALFTHVARTQCSDMEAEHFISQFYEENRGAFHNRPSLTHIIRSQQE